MADSRAGAEKIKMSLEYLVVSESKEMIKKPNHEAMSKGHRSHAERAFQWPKLEQFEQQN